MARETGYPGCGDCAGGYKERAFNTSPTCILSCKNDCNCLCVEPEITCISAWSLVGINADGFAVQLTADNHEEIVGDRSEIYFSICTVKPRECGKQRYFSNEMKVAAHCINWSAMKADTPEKVAIMTRLALRGRIHFVGVHVN